MKKIKKNLSVFKKRAKSMSLSDYFEVIKPTYRVIEIVSHKSIRNYNSANIAKCIANTYKAINKRIRFEQKKLILEKNFKISYCIDIRNSNVKFYFIVPNCCVYSILEKINEIWSKATITLLEEALEPFSDKAEYYQLSYKREDALSLNVDRKTNDPLNSILGVMDNMKDEDRVMLFYNFIPCSQISWLDRYTTTINKFKEKKSVEKAQVSFEYIVRNTLLVITKVLDDAMTVLCDFSGTTKDEENSIYQTVWKVLEEQQQLSRTTLNKKKATIVDAQIAVVSDSPDRVRKTSNALSVCQAFRTLDEDNELVYSKLKEKFDFNDTNIKAQISTFSSDECSNFLQIPARQLLNQYRINHIKTEEGLVPSQLRKGYFCLGENVYRGTKVQTYLEDEYNVGSYPLCIVGSQGAGKSTYIANQCRFALSRNEGVVLIDYIKNNELTEEVVKVIPKEKLILLDYSNEFCMQGFAFNEVSNIKKTTPFERIKNANLQVMQFVELVNAVNDESQPLQARMRKYLVAAGTVVFCTGETSLKSIIDCLEDHRKRDKYISSLDKELVPLLEDKINTLRELDEYGKPTKDNPEPGVTGTKESKIDGIKDRVSLLKEDIALEYMFNKGSGDNIDLARELEDGKIIIVKMLQDEWSSRAKDVITTFFISKIWLSTEIRGKWNPKPKRTHVITDEIFQCVTAMNMLSKKNILPQTRKFGCKFTFTIQGIQQIKGLFTSITDAGGTYMLLKGTKEEDFNLLKSKIEGFEFEDLRDMAKTYKFPSLNVVYYSQGYASFITKLPLPASSVKENCV
ncbi:hypothetical protein ACEE21_15215 [Clostridium baratii]